MSDLPDEIIAKHFPLDGPHSDRRTVDAARLIRELVRFLNYATNSPSGVSGPDTVDLVLGPLREAQIRTEQTFSQLDRSFARFAADPSAYMWKPVGPVATPADAAAQVSDLLSEAGRWAAVQVKALDQAQSYTGMVGLNADDEDDV